MDHCWTQRARRIPRQARHPIIQHCSLLLIIWAKRRMAIKLKHMSNNLIINLLIKAIEQVNLKIKLFSYSNSFVFFFNVYIFKNVHADHVIWNMIVLRVILILLSSGVSLMKILNSVGHKTAPCGTPQLLWKHLEYVLLFLCSIACMREILISIGRCRTEFYNLLVF